jgi:hypothetical protein
MSVLKTLDRTDDVDPIIFQQGLGYLFWYVCTVDRTDDVDLIILMWQGPLVHIDYVVRVVYPKSEE